MKFQGDKFKLIAGFVVLSAAFFYLRLRFIGHPLMWDEAWNILSLRAYIVNAVKDPFYWFYKFHPPLYMTFARLLLPFKEGFAIRLEYLSLFFAYLVFVAMYVLSTRIGGWKYAWFSGIFLSAMPSSIAYDTWIKRDNLASAFGYTALILLLKRKYLWCGVLLSLSLLSKESGIFFALAAIILLFFMKEKRVFKWFITIVSTIFVLSAWWYLFFSEMTTHGFSFFFTKGDYSQLWSQNSLYYLKKLLPDLGTIIFIFMAFGFIVLMWRSFRDKETKWLFPIVVALCVYVPISLLFRLKSPWLFLPAVPALTMIAGGGAVFLLEKCQRRNSLCPIFYLLILLVFFYGFTFSYADYQMETYPNGWPGALSSKKLAGYLNEHMKEDDRLMITNFTYWDMPVCPIFIYYWKSHEIQIIKTSESVNEIEKEIIKNKISWLVVVGSPDPKKNPAGLITALKATELKKPKVVGWSYVWNTEELWRER